MAGKKQSPETIAKRIASTDQVSKEAKRKQTCVKRFGVENVAQHAEIAVKIGNSKRGKRHPRQPGQQEKIVESRKANGTIKHTAATGLKISKSLLAYNQGSNAATCIPFEGKSRHNTGYVGDIWFRSSYEKQFLEFCLQHQIKVVSASTIEFRVAYFIDGKRHYYYPDFYLPDLNTVIEIKASWQLNEERTQHKISNACCDLPNFTIVTEEELSDLTYFFEDLSLSK